MIRLVVVESPYAGNIKRNVRYARAAMSDSLKRGEAPFASHLLYTQPGILCDEVESERHHGILAGLAWGKHADAVVVYVDLGITEGMRRAIESYTRLGMLVEYRRLPAWNKICNND